MNVLMVVMFELSIATQEAYKTVLGSTPRILIASLLAFFVGDLINDIVFQKMKLNHKNEIKGFAGRAILSSLCGELTDSLIFIPLAFIGQMPFKNMAIMLITQVVLKTGYEALILPITTFIVKKVNAYENK